MNRPICSEWHGNDFMPQDDKTCIFEININDEKELSIGYWRYGEIIRINGHSDFICDKDHIIRWCYIDLN